MRKYAFTRNRALAGALTFFLASKVGAIRVISFFFLLI